MSRKKPSDMAQGDREAHEAARFAGLGAAALINFGSGMSPSEILVQACIYEEFIITGQCPPWSPDVAK